MHLLGLANDETEIGLEGADRPLAAHDVPGVGGNGALDQVDQRLEVLGRSAGGRGAEGNGRGRAHRGAAPRLDLCQRGRIDRRLPAAGHRSHAGRRGTNLHRQRVSQGRLAVALPEGTGDTEAVGGEVWDRHHQVGHRIGDRIDLAPDQPRAGYFEHLVADDVAEVERFEQELEGALERDRLIERERHGRVAADGLLIQAHHVEVNGHAGLLRERVEHRGQGLLPERREHLLIELFLDEQLRRGGPRTTFGQELGPGLGQILPVLRGWEFDRTSDRPAGSLHVFHHVEKADLVVTHDGPLSVESADRPALGQELADDGIVGGELPGLLGNRLGLGKPLLVDQRVVLLHEHGNSLIDLDPLSPLAVDLGFDFGIPTLKREFSPPFAGRLLDIEPGAFDPPQQLAAGVVGDGLGVESGRNLVEQGQGITGGLLGEAFGLELPGRHLGGDPGGPQAFGLIRVGGSQWGTPATGRCSRLARPTCRSLDGLLDHLPRLGRVARSGGTGVVRSRQQPAAGKESHQHRSRETGVGAAGRGGGGVRHVFAIPGERTREAGQVPPCVMAGQGHVPSHDQPHNPGKLGRRGGRWRFSPYPPRGWKLRPGGAPPFPRYRSADRSGTA